MLILKVGVPPTRDQSGRRVQACQVERGAVCVEPPTRSNPAGRGAALPRFVEVVAGVIVVWARLVSLHGKR